MPTGLSRRAVLVNACALPLLAGFAGTLAHGQAKNGLRYGAPKPFNFEWLKAEAKRLAAAAYADPPPRAADVLERIDFDDHGAIRFKDDHTLWAEDGPYPVQFFHPGKWFKSPVKIHMLEAGGQAREILYSPEFFSFTKERWDQLLPQDLGFAGFRVMSPGNKPDWLAFLGAAYFRTAGPFGQYGLSARGVAIDCAMPTPEEFPRFTQFWLGPVAGVPNAIAIYALMDGPSITGAFRMISVKDQAVVQDIECALYARKDIARMGVAPLTSMFWFGKWSRRRADDWRPQVHDSEGLALWTGSGERIWRPLNNPYTVRTSSFLDKDPKGFGLLQRDRNFENYQDDGVFHEKRPTVWVEPLGNWGEGAVQLVEIPTDEEYHDNIVAYWVPKPEVKAGSAWTYRYRLHWTAEEPFRPPVATVVATWNGLGGFGPPRPKNRRKIAIDFDGPAVADFPEEARSEIELVVTPDRGKIIKPYSHRIVGTKRWRAVFEIELADTKPVDVRAYLKKDGKPLTETWLWQVFPIEEPAR
jgi:glucans biosynthesis protein